MSGTQQIGEKRPAEAAAGPSGEGAAGGFRKPAGPVPAKKVKNLPVSAATLESLVPIVQERYDQLFGKLGDPADAKKNSAGRKAAWKTLAEELNA